MSLNTYNGDGYRVEKTVNGAITRYLYEYDKVVLELDGAGNQIGRNVYGTNLLMRSTYGKTYYYMYNGHADVTALLKPDGTIAATYYYDAFGNIIDTTGATNNTITFAGYQYDKETGLYYLNARMYDPKTARFLQEDTYTGDRNDPLSLNLYTYCHNEPLMYRDPTGHNWITDRWDDAKKLGEKAGNALSDGAEWFADKASDAWDATKSGVSSFWESAKSTTVGAWEDTKSSASYVWKETKKKASDAWTSVKNGASEYWNNVKANTAAGWEDIKSDISNRIENSKIAFTNIGYGIKNAFSSWDGFKNASVGVGSSFANGGLNTARFALTAMSWQPNNTWIKLGTGIDWTNEKIQTNLVTDQNTYQTFSTLTDVGQMAWGAKGLFKGGIELPSLNNGPSFMDAGTGMRISGIPDDFGRMNVSPINGVDWGATGASEVKLLPEPNAPRMGRLPEKTVDPATGKEVGRFVVDSKAIQ